MAKRDVPMIQYQVRLPADVCNQIYREDIPAEILRRVLVRAVYDASAKLSWLRGRATDLREQLAAVEGRIEELEELEQADKCAERAAPVVRYLRGEYGPRTVREMARSNDPTLDRWFSDPAADKLLKECGLDRGQLVEILKRA